MMPEWPFVSVVVPVFNGADTIEDLLLSLLVLDYPKDRLEIILVDNGSTDNTRQVVEKYPVRLVEEHEKRGPAAARNKGIMQARGEIIAFTDADCTADPNWLRMLVADQADVTIGGFVGEIKGLERTGSMVEAVLNQRRAFSSLRFELTENGQPKVTLKRRGLATQSGLEHIWERLGLITYYQKRPPMPPLHFGSTGNVAYRREVFEQIGLFDTGLVTGEDLDLSWRMQLNPAYRFQPAPEAIIYHRHRATLGELFFKEQRYGLGRLLLMDKYMEVDATVRRQLVLESCLNLFFDGPYTLAMLGYRGIKALVRGKPYPTYFSEPVVDWISSMGFNYGRMKACLAGACLPGQTCSPLTERPSQV